VENKKCRWVSRTRRTIQPLPTTVKFIVTTIFMLPRVSNMMYANDHIIASNAVDEKYLTEFSMDSKAY
jgi:hypothetical protein